MREEEKKTWLLEQKKISPCNMWKPQERRKRDCQSSTNRKGHAQLLSLGIQGQQWNLVGARHWHFNRREMRSKLDLVPWWDPGKKTVDQKPPECENKRGKEG